MDEGSGDQVKIQDDGQRPDSYNWRHNFLNKDCEAWFLGIAVLRLSRALRGVWQPLH